MGLGCPPRTAQRRLRHWGAAPRRLALCVRSSMSQALSPQRRAHTPLCLLAVAGARGARQVAGSESLARFLDQREASDAAGLAQNGQSGPDQWQRRRGDRRVARARAVQDRSAHHRVVGKGSCPPCHPSPCACARSRPFHCCTPRLRLPRLRATRWHEATRRARGSQAAKKDAGRKRGKAARAPQRKRGAEARGGGAGDASAGAGGTRKLLIKWSGLGYDLCTWEHEAAAVNLPPEVLASFESRDEEPPESKRKVGRLRLQKLTKQKDEALALLEASRVLLGARLRCD